MRRPPLPPELTYLRAVAGCLRRRIRQARTKVDEGDRGALSAEAMIIIGVLVVTAIAALGIIASKIIAKARSINLG